MRSRRARHVVRRLVHARRRLLNLRRTTEGLDGLPVRCVLPRLAEPHPSAPDNVTVSDYGGLSREQVRKAAVRLLDARPMQASAQNLAAHFAAYSCDERF